MITIDLTGMILKGRYCIVEQVGSGSEGRLYLARDIELGGYWAVKEIPISRKKEAKLLRLLEHPAIPRMVDFAEQGEACYLVMEYIRGKSLQALLEEGKHFSAKELLELGLHISQVLHYLHTRKPPVYYGDLKPANLMLDHTGKLYLVDFGSAVPGYSREQRICQGTKGFAAPEQFEGKMCEKSDVYALGKTIRALAGNRWYGVLLQAPGLLYFVKKCCRRSEKARYGDMEEAGRALLRIRQRLGKGRRTVMAAFVTALFLCTAGASYISVNRKPDFFQALEEVTGLYRQPEFLSGEKEEAAEICKEAEKELQKLLKEYTDQKEQRRLLLLLAVNGELQEKWERAAFYYEQLLLYDPEYREGYGEYGMFLWRTGQREASIRLREDYEKLEKEGLLENGSGKALSMWKEKIDEEINKEERLSGSHDAGSDAAGGADGDTSGR
ncbi:protein kinase [Ruminococcus sp. 5_1_39BFAA]|uniref:protein kinase domain-containing protein n=1 Tax=Ruminococcus sp. 5_1_39BFAA TaxID=457412 RepID=UPI003568E16F